MSMTNPTVCPAKPANWAQMTRQQRFTWYNDQPYRDTPRSHWEAQRASIAPAGDKPVRYCPVCSARMDTIAQYFPHLAQPIHFHTCFAPGCPVHGRTCSDKDIDDAATLAKWNVVQRFDVRSGEAL